MSPLGQGELVRITEWGLIPYRVSGGDMGTRLLYLNTKHIGFVEDAYILRVRDCVRHQNETVRRSIIRRGKFAIYSIWMSWFDRHLAESPTQLAARAGLASTAHLVLRNPTECCALLCVLFSGFPHSLDGRGGVGDLSSLQVVFIIVMERLAVPLDKGMTRTSWTQSIPLRPSKHLENVKVKRGPLTWI
jgi:hypothetical protein